MSRRLALFLDGTSDTEIATASESLSEESRTLDSMLAEFALGDADTKVPLPKSEVRAVAKDLPRLELFVA